MSAAARALSPSACVGSLSSSPRTWLVFTIADDRSEALPLKSGATSLRIDWIALLAAASSAAPLISPTRLSSWSVVRLPNASSVELMASAWVIPDSSASAATAFVIANICCAWRSNKPPVSMSPSTPDSSNSTGSRVAIEIFSVSVTPSIWKMVDSSIPCTASMVRGVIWALAASVAFSRDIAIIPTDPPVEMSTPSSMTTIWPVCEVMVRL